MPRRDHEREQGAYVHQFGQNPQRQKSPCGDETRSESWLPSVRSARVSRQKEPVGSNLAAMPEKSSAAQHHHEEDDVSPRRLDQPTIVPTEPYLLKASTRRVDMICVGHHSGEHTATRCTDLESTSDSGSNSSGEDSVLPRVRRD